MSKNPPVFYKLKCLHSQCLSFIKEKSNGRRKKKSRKQKYVT